MKGWSIVYEKAIREDGSLFFPDRLNHEFLEKAKRTLGSMLFANQYLNEVFPADDAKFKREWFKHYDVLPNDRDMLTFAHIDPAISAEDGADYTGIAVVSVDSDHNWYLRLAKRERLNPTQIVDTLFNLQKIYGTNGIGVESVAYQKALIHLASERMQKTGDFVPMKEIKRGPKQNKQLRIMRLIPRMEWGKFYHHKSMNDFEKELLQFPRSAHDDISDAVSSLEEIVFYPTKEAVEYEPQPGSPDWERKIIRGYYNRSYEEARANAGNDGGESDFE